MSLVLVYVPDPESAIRQIARILKPGGTGMIIDMVPHDREGYRRTMGHQHLGFDEKTVGAWARAAGLGAPRYRRLRVDTAAKGPGLFVATMGKRRQ